MHTGDLLTELLVRCGVTRVFGVPGGQTCALYDGILKREPTIRHVVMRDERNTAFAADAFARLTRKVGVCDVTVGPGCTKLPSGLMEAYYSSIPILCIISELPQAWRHLYERGAALQAMDQEGLISQFCKWVTTLNAPEHLSTVLPNLLRRAVSGRPGPVALIVPHDVFDTHWTPQLVEDDNGENPEQVRASDFARLGQFPLSRSAPDPSNVAQASSLLLQAKCPVLLAGGGVHIADATEEVRELAELLTMPVITTFSGRGALEDTHPLSLGLLGNMGTGCAKEAAEAADVLLLGGFKSGQNSTFNWKLPRPDQRLIHLDIDPAEIGKVFPTEVGLVGDAKLGLRALIDAIRNGTESVPYNEDTGERHRVRSLQGEGRERTLCRSPALSVPRNEERLKWIRSLRASWQREVGEALTSNDTPIKPQRVMEELNALTSADDIVCCDASYVTGWGMMFYNVRKAGKVILAPRGSAGLGFGIPAAIGAACARPDAKIIALCGDHGVCYALGELTTAVYYGMNVKVIVFNNQGSRWIDHWHRMYFNGTGEPFVWGDTDFATVGKGFGCLGIRVEQPDDLADTLRQALEHDGPAVVDVVVSGEETPIAAYRKALEEKQKVGYHG